MKFQPGDKILITKSTDFFKRGAKFTISHFSEATHGCMFCGLKPGSNPDHWAQVEEVHLIQPKNVGVCIKTIALVENYKQSHLPDFL